MSHLDGTLTGGTTHGRSRPGSNGNEEALKISEGTKTEASPPNAV